MKKMMSIVFAYSLFCLIVCFVIAAFLKRPLLMSNDIMKYSLLQGVMLFSRIMPAVILSGALVACSITFKDSSARFIFGHYRFLITNSIVLVAIIFVFAEVISPLIESKQAKMEATPVAYNDLMSLGKKNLMEKHATLASKYASDALMLNPKSEEARKLYEDAVAGKDEEKRIYIAKNAVVSEKNDARVEGNFSYHGIGQESASSLLKKSDDALDEKKWLDAHYYADLAEKFGTEGKSIDEAKDKALSAWEKLNTPPSSATSEEMELFGKKSHAYLLLVAGRNIEAYYEFSAIAKSSEKASKDPDVQKYLEIASEKVRNEYFFIDELEDFKKFEVDKNVYFSVTREDGSYDVIFIRGITPIKSDSGIVKYLRGFSLHSYDKDGNFVKSIFAQYAKLFSRPYDSFSDSEKKFYGVPKKVKNVSFILLHGLDSDDPSRISEPEFTFADNVLKKEKSTFVNTKYILLGLSAENFNLLCESSYGADKMNLFSLWRIFKYASDFGYSSEIYGSTLIHRLTYPLLLLCAFVFLGYIAWNNKLSDGQMFKFKWVLLIPVSTVIIHFVLEIVHYFMRLLNFIYIWFAGGWSVFLAVSTEFLILLVISWKFIRRGE